ncbi:Uncharacterised protein g10050 [Pycnogonum litorale]
MDRQKHLKIPETDIESLADSETTVDEEEDRGTWTGRFDFLLSALGYAVGLGNVWRFPYLCFKHGGGSFLIPYLIMLVLVGIPIMFLEFSIGQFSALASLPLFKNLCPLFAGIGYSILITSMLGTAMYMVVLSWAIFYLFDSFRSDVQWQYCHHSFNTLNCFRDSDFRECKSSGGVYLNRTCFNQTVAEQFNLTDIAAKDRRTSSEEYFNKFVVGRSTGIDDFAGFNYRIWLCILASWLIVFFSCIKGIKSSGKVVYFTATFPYLVLVILLIRGVTLDGALDGILFYVSPKWHQLGSITIWQEAAVQIFLSLGVGSGGAITLASYNNFQNNVVRDALVISIGNCLTSIFGGFVIFSVIGFIAFHLNKSVEDVIRGGPGLAFVVYPDAIANMPLSPLWAILFFLMLITLGLDSVFGTVENIVSSVVDEVPKLRSKKVYVLLGLCVIGGIMGLPLSLGSGIYFLDLIFAVVGWKNLLNGILEFLIISYFLGLPRFFQMHRSMTDWMPNIVLRYFIIGLFAFVTPLILCTLVLMTFITYEPFKSAGYIYPDWAYFMGWFISLSPLLIIVLFACHLMYKHREVPVYKRLKALIAPTEVWYRNQEEEQKRRRKQMTKDSLKMNTKESRPL